MGREPRQGGEGTQVLRSECPRSATQKVRKHHQWAVPGFPVAPSRATGQQLVTQVPLWHRRVFYLGDAALWWPRLELLATSQDSLGVQASSYPRLPCGDPLDPHFTPGWGSLWLTARLFLCAPSAGVGRTGTFIVIDAMMDMMQAEQRVDVFEFVSRIRSQRPQMVQTDVSTRPCGRMPRWQTRDRLVHSFG